MRAANGNNSILVGGLGNIFMGDDAFGVEAVRALAPATLPQEVQVVDFGIRAYDLAFALTEPYETIILVDAVPRGEAPGTIYLIEPDLDELSCRARPPADAHGLDPVGVLQMAQSMGSIRAKVYLVGCEPSTLEGQDGDLGLSPAVRAAIPQALDLIDSLVCRLLNLKTRTNAGPVPV